MNNPTNTYNSQNPLIDLYIEQVHTPLNGMDLYNAVDDGLENIFLDSSKEDSPYSNYSIIGVHPFLTVKYKNGKIFIKKHPHSTFSCIEETHIFDYLNSLILKYKITNPTHLPFIGGGLGYFGYDLSKELENIPTLAKKEVDIPDCYFVFYDNHLILNLNTNFLTITGFGIIKPSCDSVSDLTALVLNYVPQLRQHSNQLMDLLSNQKASLDFKSPFTKNTYMDAVESMRHYIEDGHIYITNMTQTYKSVFTKPAKATYEELRFINPAPFSAYMPLDGFSILSSSPERFLDIRDSKVQTRPIKGTMPRGKNEEEDLKNKTILINSEKDKSELLMIVDLERNDLSKVCVPGSVKVTELFEIETYATVFHLVSTIEGYLKPNHTSVDCIQASFPGGSITGAPKIRAMEIIEELEPTSRNIYTGSIGYLGFDGNADFNIVIRTIVLKDNQAFIGVGGGITWESDPESEYNETLDKANALFRTLNQMNNNS